MQKPLILLLLTVLIPFMGNAQGEDNQKTEIKDRVLLDVYHDNWLHDMDTLQTRWYSFGASGSYLFDLPVSGSKRFSFGLGLAISAHNVHNNGYITKIDISNDSVYNPDYSTIKTYSDTLNIKKNKLSTNYIDVPFEIRFRSKPDKNGNPIKVSAGLRAGYLINIHSKWKDDNGKYKWYNFSDLEKWRFGAHARVGYQRWSLYAYYGINGLFKDGKGEKITPVSLGFTYTLLE